jgi:hypothetical protein
MLSLLPPELLRQVIESSVPHTFHTDTYFERQGTLLSFCLVSRRFRQIAQPILLEIVQVERAGQLHQVLDQYAANKHVASRIHIVVAFWDKSFTSGSLEHLPRMVPALTSLSLRNAATDLEPYDASFLAQFSS